MLRILSNPFMLPVFIEKRRTVRNRRDNALFIAVIFEGKLNIFP